jgi:hypothetical protein
VVYLISRFILTYFSSFSIPPLSFNFAVLKNISPNAISTGTQAKQDDYLVGLEQYGLQQPSAQQKLTPLDMNIPRLYGIRLVLCFPLTSGADKLQMYV